MLSRMRALRSFPALLLVALVGCGAPPHRTTKTSAAPAAEAMTAEQMSPGAAVLVERGGQWLPGSVVAQVGPDRFRVHYEGYGPEWDEDVGPARLRPAAAASDPNAAPLAAGESVLVDLSGRLMLGRIVEMRPDGKLKIQYDGFEPAAFEEVVAKRVRRPFAGESAHRVGEDVTVRAQGSSARARVVAAVSSDRWLVRFDGAGAAYDRVVGPDMLVGTGGSAKAVAAPADAKASTSDAPTLSIGDQVLVSHRGTWHAATVAALRGGEVGVRYAEESTGGKAAGRAGDESVSAQRVVAAPGKKKPGVPYAPKELVYIEWHGMFVEGRVLRKTGAGQYKVRFAGTGPARDEIVVSRRLRPRG